jgi:hypothetical protein
LSKLGDLNGLESGLKTSLENGLKNDLNDLAARAERYGKNEVYTIYICKLDLY